MKETHSAIHYLFFAHFSEWMFLNFQNTLSATYNCLLCNNFFQSKREQLLDSLSLPHSYFWKHVAEQLALQASLERKEKRWKTSSLPWHIVHLWFLRMVLCQCWTQSGRCGMYTSSGHLDGRRGATLGHYKRFSMDKDARTEWKKKARKVSDRNKRILKRSWCAERKWKGKAWVQWDWRSHRK